MKSFEYTIQDSLGIHARPAGLLVKEANKFDSAIMIYKDSEKSADASKIMKLMSLAVKNGNTVKVTIEGSDEEKAYSDIKSFFESNL